jgi:hypothetical protein
MIDCLVYLKRRINAASERASFPVWDTLRVLSLAGSGYVRTKVLFVVFKKVKI